MLVGAIYPGPANVTVRCADALDVVRAATERDFLYLDPPYGASRYDRYYRYQCDDDFHKRLADSLKDCRAPWLLSIDASLRDHYEDWCDIEEIARVEQFRRTPYMELLVGVW